MVGLKLRMRPTMTRRRLGLLSALGLPILAVTGWAWLVISSTGLTVSVPAKELPPGDLLVSLQTSPFEADGKGGLRPGEGGLWKVDLKTGSNRRRRSGLIDQARVSPDGRWIVYRDDHFQTWVEPLDAGPRLRLAIESGSAVWAPDSRSVVASDYRDVSTGKTPRRDFLGHLRIQVADQSVDRLPVTEPAIIQDWSPDGRWLSMIPWEGGKNVLRSPDGRESRTVSADEAAWGHRFSPDGLRLAYFRSPVSGPRARLAPEELCLIGVDGSDPRVVRNDLIEAQTLCWSPDGSAILVKLHKSIVIVRLDGDLVAIPLFARKPFDLFNPIAGLDADPLFIGAAEWVKPANPAKK